jgi:hypothetical protein
MTRCPELRQGVQLVRQSLRRRAEYGDRLRKTTRFRPA